MLGTLTVYSCHSYVLNHVRLFVTSWTVACQAPLSMGILQARIVEWVAIPFYNCSDSLWGILFVKIVVQDNALLLVNKKGNKIKLLKTHFYSKNTISKSNY